MPNRIRVGIVGASTARGWAAAAHVPALARLDEYQLVAVATTREASARAAAEAFGARHAFTGAAALANHPDVDLVVVSVKAPDHAPAVRAAIEAGKQVLVEWPLTVTAGEAAELAAAAEAARLRHAVVLQVYASPGARFVRDLVREGRIGELAAVAFTGGGDPLGGSRIYRDLAWGTAAGTGNDILTIMVGHALAAVEVVTGAALTEVSAVTARHHDRVGIVGSGESVANGVDGQVVVAGLLDGGAVASLCLLGGNAAAPDGFQLRLTGTEGTLTVTPADPGHYSNWATWRVRLAPAGGEPHELAIPERYRLAPAGLPDGPVASIASLYRLLGAGSAELATFHTAARSQRTLEAITRAAATGTRQRLTTAAVHT
ncbi:Gfo/Idh/MocA family oxidoreductase [Phytohabitans flavus]|uniref:Oxidoreductase n=1 Tax=Phytohabitans flavus TaxID=1076124 RepID=A0A6F8XUH5_9ACTN|nr:Gfo/Idh/MocA family oxidoreductase [Phytohabitans flavus]BCB77483.1 oxidoreductase [Phytohabitans flavus]